MKFLAVFPAILAFAASCYTHTHSVKNKCRFPDEFSIKQPDTKDVLEPNFGHSLNTLMNLPSESSNNDKAVYMASPNVLPMSSAKLIKTLRSYSVMPDPTPCIDIKSLLEEDLDNNRDLKDDIAIEIPSPNGPLISSAKLEDAVRSYAVVPDPTPCIDTKGLLEEYLANSRDLKNDKPNEMASRNVPPKSSGKLIVNSRNYAVVPDLTPCIDLIRKQEGLLDDNWDLKNDIRNDKPVEIPPSTANRQTLAETLSGYFSDLVPLKDLTRRNQEYFDDEEDLKDINAADLENFYINEYYNFVPKASSSFIEN